MLPLPSHLPFHETATSPAFPPLIHSFSISFFLFDSSLPPSTLSLPYNHLSSVSAASMAVQARDLSLKLPDLRNRPSQYLVDNSFADANECAFDNLNCTHLKLPGTCHQQNAQQAACPITMFSNSEKWLGNPMRVNESALKKKRKDSSKLHAAKRPRTQPLHQMSSSAAPEEFFNEALSLSAMHLSLGQGVVRPHAEDSSIVTSSGSNIMSRRISLSSRLSAFISKQRNEIFNMLKIQTEQLRLIIEERIRLHSKTFLATVGEGLSQTLHARDMELEGMSRKNVELQQKLNHLSLETQAWQSKALSYNAMVSALRADLQQALMHQTRCQLKMEGFGESDNDAASAHVDEAAKHTMATPSTTSKALLQRACKKCKSKEVSILLLPCLHLCVCSECQAEIEMCPACNVQICDRVEVYLS